MCANAGTVAPRGNAGEMGLFVRGRSIRFRGRVPSSFWGSLLMLVGHLVGTFFIFLVFLVLTWGISYSVSVLDGRHKFPQNVMDIITQVELYLLYIDIALCTIVLLLGTARFCMDLLENRYE